MARCVDSIGLAAQLCITCGAIYHGVIAAVSSTGSVYAVLCGSLTFGVAEGGKYGVLAAQLCITGSTIYHGVIAAVSSTGSVYAVLCGSLTFGVAEGGLFFLLGSTARAGVSLDTVCSTGCSSGGGVATAVMFPSVAGSSSFRVNNDIVADNAGVGGVAAHGAGGGGDYTGVAMTRRLIDHIVAAQFGLTYRAVDHVIVVSRYSTGGLDHIFLHSRTSSVTSCGNRCCFCAAADSTGVLHLSLGSTSGSDYDLTSIPSMSRALPCTVFIVIGIHSSGQISAICILQSCRCGITSVGGIARTTNTDCACYTNSIDGNSAGTLAAGNAYITAIGISCVKLTIHLKLAVDIQNSVACNGTRIGSGIQKIHIFSARHDHLTTLIDCHGGTGIQKNTIRSRYRCAIENGKIPGTTDSQT